MNPFYMVWAINLQAFLLLAFGFWWLIGHMPGMPDYKLLCGLAALTGFVLNHFRWLKIARKINDIDVLGKFHHLMTVNYLIILLAFGLVDFRQ
jgi:hypothetical protein